MGKEMQAVIKLMGKLDPSLKNAIRQAEAQTKSLKAKMSSIGKSAATGAVSAAKSIGRIGVAAVGAGAVAAAALGKSALDAYSQYEQLSGGIETLFKGDASTVMANAQAAYKTAGISANSYMEQATSFSASLTQALGGDTAKAAKYADQAIRDMSDNSNKMGTSIETVQGTYQSLMRGNYAMLDNLKLGYGGTKSELERLVSDASKLTGQALDPAKFSDVITAIHAVQENMGITGTTAKEAATTIEGSVNSMKGAWNNWLSGLGQENADMGALTSSLVDSISTVVKNVAPRIGVIFGSLFSSLPNLAGSVASSLGPALAEGLAQAWNSAVAGLGSLGIQLPQIDASQITGAFSQVMGVLSQIGAAIMPTINQIAQVAIPAISTAFQGLATTIGPAISQVMAAIGPPLVNLATAVLPPLGAAIAGIAPLLASIVSAVLPPLISFITPTASLLMNLAAAVIPVLTAAINALNPVIQIVISAFMMLSPVVSALSPLFSAVQSAVSGVQGVFTAVQAAINLVKTAFQSAQGPIGAIAGVFRAVQSAISGVIGVARAAASAIGSVISAAGKIGGGIIGGIGSLLGGGKAKGGFTFGPELAGEDPRYPTEAVISFNPAYRAKNIRHWQRAGRMLGVRSSDVTTASGGSRAAAGGVSYDFSGMTFSPTVEVRGNASKDDIIAAIKACEGDFIDTVTEMLARRSEAAYA